MAGSANDAEVAELRAEIERLRTENAGLLADLGGTTPEPTTSPKFLAIQGVHVKQELCEWGIMVSVILVAVLLFAIPRMKPFKRCCETRRHVVYPVLLLGVLAMLGVTLHLSEFINVNALFFVIVGVLTIAIDQLEQVLIMLAGLMILAMAWKFKDRILEALGIDNPSEVIGEARDWATCWSMQRFRPIEIFIWKVEGLPAVKIHQSNDIFCEVTLGYNSSMRTRVHLRAGQTCMMKESIQLNFDPYDVEKRLHINVKNQNVIGSDDLASVQLNVSQILRLEGAADSQNKGVGCSAYQWNSSSFHAIDLLPKGKIYVRFAPVVDSGDGSLCSCFSCCFPRSPNENRQKALIGDPNA